jgi:ribosomal protein S4
VKTSWSKDDLCEQAGVRAEYQDVRTAKAKSTQERDEIKQKLVRRRLYTVGLLRTLFELNLLKTLRLSELSRSIKPEMNYEDLDNWRK